ncbi:MAG: hypothetical protein PHD74_06710 [Candidatus Krumholzibacteria bacterium]|nr:hypothetical protein [Candidatus Krumholzibacteria bacterium]
MNSQTYIAVAIVVLAVVAFLVFVVRKGKRKGRLTPLAGLAFAFILAGLFFGDNRVVGYGLLGVGVVLAVIDIFKKSMAG